MLKPLVQVTCATLVLVAIGAVSIWTGQALLVASLGSAAFIQILTPDAPSARVWPMAVGQLCGIGGGFVGVFACAAAGAQPFTHDHPLLWIRVLCAALAIAVTAGLQLALKAVSAAGATLALLVALGSEPPAGAGALRLVAGVALVVVLGEAARRLVLATPGPSSSRPSPPG